MNTLLVVAALAAPADKVALPSGLQKTADAVTQAYFQGDSFRVWQVLSPAVARMKGSQVKKLDQALAAREIPSVGRLLVEARMKLVQQNLWRSLPQPKLRERMLALQGLHEQIQEKLKSTADHPLVAGTAPKPKTFAEFKKMLWDIHVLQNQFQTTERKARYAVVLANGIPQRALKHLSESEHNLVAAGNNELVQNFAKAQRDLLELEMETRLNRLDYGLSVLRKQEAKLSKERFIAAYSTVFDAKVLNDFLQKNKGPFARSALNQEGLPQKVVKRAEEAKAAAGKLATKSKQFFDGLHWWLRGRYGSGPELGGLTKSQLRLVRDTIQIQSELLKEKQTLEIVF